jgi:biopolymer transport protein ExbD
MHQPKPAADAKVALPITPMLDMTFQLLFFFIINFHPADLEGQLKMALPAEEVPQRPGGKELEGPRRPSELEFPADLTVKVRTQRGEISQGGIVGIFVSSSSGKDVAVQGLDGLRTYLQEKRGTPESREGIQVMGDSKLRIKYLMRVMDICREAGFDKVRMVPAEDFGR